MVAGAGVHDGFARPSYHSIQVTSATLFQWFASWPVRSRSPPLAWMPTEGKLANKLTVCVRRHHCIHVLGFHFTPRSAEGLGSGYPKTRRNRLPPSQGMTRSVLSNPAATNNGL